MVKQIDKNEARLRRHRRVRNKISGTAARPRLDVFRSAKHIYAQIIDDEQGVTLVSASTMDKDFNGFGGNVEAAAEIGKKVAAKALEKGDLAGLCGSLYNVFEEVTALPELSEIRQELRRSGALAAMMTGSGSAVFGIFPEEAAAKAAAEKMAESRWAIGCRGIGRPE